MVQIRKAQRKNLSLKMALHGISGMGKTYSALKLMSLLAGDRPIGLIDTENYSSEKYAGSVEDKLFNFDIVGLGNPERPDDLTAYNPDAYIAALEAFRKEGYKHLVIDSLSHLYMWSLDEVDAQAKKFKGNTFVAWKSVTPAYSEVLRWITNSDMNIICTLRSKEEYDMSKDANGKSQPKAIGLKPIIREGFRYEFDITGQMDNASLIIDKTRCFALQDKVFNKPGEDLASIISNWLEGGLSEEDAKKNQYIVKIVGLQNQLKGFDVEVDEVDLNVMSNEELIALGKSLAAEVASKTKVEETNDEESIPS